MNLTKLGLLFVIGLFMVSLPIALAEEEEGEEGEPAWFPFLELGGAIIGIIATAITFKNYSGMKGGALGVGFKFVTVSLAVLTTAVIFRGLQEQLMLVSEFMGELVFELFIYLALILIAIGSKKSYDLTK